jgi:hypothetical protein
VALQGSVTKGYDGSRAASLAASNYQVTGALGPESVTITQTAGSYDTGGAGAGKTVTVALAPGDYAAGPGTSLANYQLPTTVAGPVGAVTPAPLTARAEDKSKVQGAANPALTIAYTGLVNGETKAVITEPAIATTATADSPVGTYPITLTGGTAANYALTRVDGTLTVVAPAPTLSATHAYAGPGFLPGGTVTVTNALTYTGTPSGLRWEVPVPSGWLLVSTSGATGSGVPAAGTVGLLEFVWAQPATSPVTFSYTLRAPADASTPLGLSAVATLSWSGSPVQALALPDPLLIAPVTTHSADSDRNLRIGLLELTRVIELYNTRNAASRTGGYAVAPAGTVTEDGFTAAPERAPAALVTLVRYHSADSNRDGKIGLLELTRVIELYNTRSGGSRTGQYKPQAGTEDGFAPGT